jgi:LEA14-like dessication related protein
MNRSRFIKACGIVFLLIILIGGSLFFYFKLNPKDAINLILPEINKINLIKAVVTEDTANIEIHTILQNKSFYTLRIDSLYYDLKLKDLSLPEEKIYLNLIQKKSQIDTVALPLKLPLKKIKQTIQTSQEEDSLDLEANFHLVYHTFLGNYHLTYRKKIKFSRPVPPEIKIIKVEHRKIRISDGTVKATIQLQVKNKGKNLDLKTNNIRYKFTIEKLLQEVGSYDQTVRIKPGSETTVSIPVSIKIGKLLKAGWLILKDKDIVNYTVTIEADMEEEKSLNQKIPVIVTASGVTEIVK